ncbi:MAG: cell wall anchor protein, partial [Muribaculaceae bacterium]|nr:cell wall anchor protein [Muribaculaceae bacterium]
NLWENGMEKEYFTQLTDILRDYLYARFGINAMEMTSRQIMQTLADQADVKEKRSYVRKILDVADFVKFAKVRPLPADNVEAFDNAVNFVKETIEKEPEKAPEENAPAGSQAAQSKKGGGR